MSEIIKNCIRANYYNYREFYYNQPADFSDECIKRDRKFNKYEELYLIYIFGFDFVENEEE